MQTAELKPDDELKLYVRTILIYEEENDIPVSNLPFYADGYPGIMFQITHNGLCVLPQKKWLPVFFLYGQTIHPIELQMTGKFRLIVFQLYPFAVSHLLEINPRELNDQCYDLSLLPAYRLDPVNETVQNKSAVSDQIQLISSFLTKIARTKKTTINDQIQLAIQLIIQSNGMMTIREIRSQLHITERTFERQFISLVGISPKQFAKMIQFQTSLTQLTNQNFDKLTDVVFENGFSDQSHFIKSFRQFTGQTPGKFRKPGNH